MIAAATDTPACPRCGGAVWDNRASKRSPRAPDFKCRDRSCDGAIWPKREARTVTTADAPSVLSPAAELPQAGQPAAAGGGAREKLGACYLECLRFTLEKVLPEYRRAGVAVDAATIASTTATLFIQRCGRR